MEEAFRGLYKGGDYKTPQACNMINLQAPKTMRKGPLIVDSALHKIHKVLEVPVEPMIHMVDDIVQISPRPP